MRWLSPLVALLLLLLSLTTVAAQTNPVSIPLPAVNGSGESGSISLTPSGSDLTELFITLSGQPQLQTQYQTIGGQQVINPSTYGGAVPQVAGIYSGSCGNPTPTSPPNLGATTPNGPNVTGNGWFVVKMSVSNLLAGNYVVAVHKDATETSPLVACAPLVAGPESGASTSASTAPAAAASTAPSTSSTTASTAAATVPALPKTGTPRGLIALVAGAGLLLVGGGLRLRGVARPGRASTQDSSSEPREVQS